MLLITIFVELRMVAGRSRTLAGSPQAVSRRPCCAVALRRKPWSEQGMGRGMASVNQTRPHCVNQMGNTFETLGGTAWQGERHRRGLLCVNRPLVVGKLASMDTIYPSEHMTTEGEKSGLYTG